MNDEIIDKIDQLLLLYEETKAPTVPSVTCARAIKRQKEGVSSVFTRARASDNRDTSKRNPAQEDLPHSFKPQNERLACRYDGKITRIVNSEICKWHIEAADKICLEECSNPWVMKNLKSS